jgi:carbonic anhydrase
MPVLDDLLAQNALLAPTLQARPRGDGKARKKLCVVTCVDPRLDGVLLESLGLAPGDAAVIRVEGAVFVPGASDLLRSVAAAVYLHGVDEVLVVAPSDAALSRLAQFDLPGLLRTHGIDAAAIPGSPTSFLGGVTSIQEAMLVTARTLRTAPQLPRTLVVHAALFDVAQAKLQVVERGDALVASGKSANDDPLAYQPGPIEGLTGRLGDGLGHLAASPIAALSGAQSSALAMASSMFGRDVPGLQSALPPGWGDTEGVLKGSNLRFEAGSLDTQQPLPGASSQVSFESRPRVAVVDMKPKPQSKGQQGRQTGGGRPNNGRTNPGRTHQGREPKYPPPPTEPARARPGKGAASEATLLQCIDKLVAFYQAEFDAADRTRLSHALFEAMEEGKSSDELLKLAVKPILEAGNKRYQVLDQLITLKETLASRPPAETYELLAPLFE